MVRFVSVMIMALWMMSCANQGGRQAAEGASQPDEETITGLQDSKPVRIKLSIKDARPMSRSFGDIEELRLSDAYANFVGIPGYIKVEGDTLYIIDPVKSTGFYAYLHDGRQLFSYCSPGSGPEDFGMLFGLTVDDTLLSSFDFSSRALVFVDKNGNFAKRIAVNPMACGAMADKSGGIWTNYSNQQLETTKLSWRATPESEEIEILPVPEYLKGMTAISGQDLSRLDDGSINYCPVLEPRVYGLSDGKAWLKYELDFDGLWPDEATIAKEYSGNDWASKFMSFPITTIRVEENNRWLVVSFDYEGDKYLHIFDKMRSDGATYRDDRDFYFSPEAVSGNKLYIPTKDDTIEIINLTEGD